MLRPLSSYLLQDAAVVRGRAGRGLQAWCVDQLEGNTLELPRVLPNLVAIGIPKGRLGRNILAQKPVDESALAHALTCPAS